MILVDNHSVCLTQQLFVYSVYNTKTQKNNKAIIKPAFKVYDWINEYCDVFGQSETIAVESAITTLIDEYENKQHILDEPAKRN